MVCFLMWWSVFVFLDRHKLHCNTTIDNQCLTVICFIFLALDSLSGRFRLFCYISLHFSMLESLDISTKYQSEWYFSFSIFYILANVVFVKNYTEYVAAVVKNSNNVVACKFSLKKSQIGIMFPIRNDM